jgi:hypothetical protein
MQVNGNLTHPPYFPLCHGQFTNEIEKNLESSASCITEAHPSPQDKMTGVKTKKK